MGLTTSPKSVNSLTSCFPSRVRASTRFGTRMTRGSPCLVARISPTSSSAATVPSRSRPDGVQGTMTKLAVAIDATYARVLGAVSTTTYPYSAATSLSLRVSWKWLGRQGQFRKQEIAACLVLPNGTPTVRFGVNQGDAFSSFVQFRRDGNREGGLTHTAFVSRYTDNAAHQMNALYIANSVSDGSHLLGGVRPLAPRTGSHRTCLVWRCTQREVNDGLRIRG